MSELENASAHDNLELKPLEASRTSVRRRAAAYPSMDIETAISGVYQIRDKLGQGEYSREDLAKALGHSSLSGPASSKIAAFIQFGLLSRNGNVYELSQLATKIITPIDNQEKRAAIASAVRQPQVYAKLIDEYDGQVLPQMLNNIIVRRHGISERSAGQAVSNFKKSLEFAGILKNGIVHSHIDSEIKTPTLKDNQTESPPVDLSATMSNHGSTVEDGIVITIPNTDIKIIFPKEYAFKLATGGFSKGIKALEENSKELNPAKEEGING